MNDDIEPGSAFVGTSDDWMRPYLAAESSAAEDLSIVDEDEAPSGTRALIYLRVSTTGQVNKDFDPEGISLPAQRKACLRKAEQLGLNVIDEYVEPGKSATEMAKRVAFQTMLERIRRERDVDYVIVFELSRFARNRLDDAIVMADLKKRGVTLISATESIDDTPVGQLMHGILAAFNEYRSAKDGADVAYKMGEKARKGGTLGQAPLGYLNIIMETEGGRKIRTVEIDPKRGPLVRQAFELYASGDYSTLDIERIMTTRGLLTRRSPKRTAKPVTHKAWAKLFRNRYYIGIVTYKGQEEIPGRHEPLIDDVLFERVQRLLDEHGVAGERRRVNHHHLKGSLFCGRCREDGIIRRQIVQRSAGRHGGEYWYFFCIGNQRGGGCNTPHYSADRVEDAVVEHYKTIAFAPQFIAAMKGALDRMLAESEAAQRLYRKQLEAQLRELDTKETNLVELAADGAMPQARIKTRLTEIVREREKLQAELSSTQLDLSTGAEFLTTCLDLLRNPYELYRNASDQVRRRLNQAIFKRLYVFDEKITGHELQPQLAELQAIQAGAVALEYGHGAEVAANVAGGVLRRHLPETEIATRRGGDRLRLVEGLACGFSLGHVSSNELLVRVKRL